MKKIKINTEKIQLDQFLKWANLVDTGGEAKKLIKGGNLRVNGEIEYRRGKKLYPGDVVEFVDSNTLYRVTKE